jgi:hypothetical protein
MQIKNSFSHPDMEAVRSGWFTCSCCPTNVVRLMPSIPGYVYAQKDNDVFVNLFINGNATLTVNNKPLQITQQNNYPWDGNLAFTLNPTAGQNFNLLVRIPGWAQNTAIPSDLYSFASASTAKVVININGQPVDYTIKNGYAVLNRAWKKGDVVTVNLPMEVRRVTASANIKDDIGKVAIQRGPLMYCAEWLDNNGRAANIIIPGAATFTTTFKPTLLNGVTILQSTVPVVNIDTTANTVNTALQTFTAIPYYAWANRGRGEMMVWFPERIKDIDLVSNEQTETVVK